MTTQTLISVTPESLDSHVACDDALINFSFETFACSAPFVAFTEEGRVVLRTGSAMPVGCCEYPEAVRELLSDSIQRFVIVSDGTSAAEQFASRLQIAGIPHVMYMLAEECSADAFMDEEDSEAVAERLRQLGYL